MSIIILILAGIVALEHLYIMYLETFATHSDTTSRVFNMSKEELQRDSVTNLFKNQGIYNGLIAVFLLYGIFTNSQLLSFHTEYGTFLVSFVFLWLVFLSLFHSSQMHRMLFWRALDRFTASFPCCPKGLILDLKLDR